MSSSTEDQNLILPISISLQQIANTLAYIAVNLDSNKDKTQIELVKVLLSFGYERVQIAAILNTSVPSVTARIAELKKKKD